MIADSHNDFLTKLPTSQCKAYLEDCQNGNILGLLCSVFTSEYSRSEALRKIKFSSSLLSEFNNSNYKLHIEDLSFLKSQKDLSLLCASKPFSCSLTWNNDNQFAGGNFGTAGLSRKGKEIIELLENKNIVIDTAHLNYKSFYCVCKTTTKPLFCSHTGLRFVIDSTRNLTDRQLKTITDSGGYFGLFLSPTFMTKNMQMTSQKFAQIIYKTLCRFDCENNLGIGSDFFGIGNHPKDLCSYKDFEKVELCLKNFGVRQQTIDKIFYQNFIDFVKKIK